MTVKKAIKMIQSLIEYKEFCVKHLDEEKFTWEVEPLRAGLVRLAQKDKEALEEILTELKPKNDSKRKA